MVRVADCPSDFMQTGRICLCLPPKHHDNDSTPQHQKTSSSSTVAILSPHRKCHSSDAYSSSNSKQFRPWTLQLWTTDATPKPACGLPQNIISKQEASRNCQPLNTTLARPACRRLRYRYPPLLSIVQPAVVSRNGCRRDVIGTSTDICTSKRATSTQTTQNFYRDRW